MGATPRRPQPKRQRARSSLAAGAQGLPISAVGLDHQGIVLHFKAAAQGGIGALRREAPAPREDAGRGAGAGIGGVGGIGARETRWPTVIEARVAPRAFRLRSATLTVSLLLPH